MGASEYVLVLVSIILGLGLCDMLVSLHRLLRAGRAVTWDWAAPWAAIIVLFINLRTWWSLFPGRDDAPTTIGQFLPVLVGVILLFLMSASVLPDEVPEKGADGGGLDLKAWFEGNRRYFWTLMSLSIVWNSVMVVMDRLGAGQGWARAIDGVGVDLIVIAALVSLVFLRARWWLALVMLLAMAGPALWLGRSVG